MPPSFTKHLDLVTYSSLVNSFLSLISFMEKTSLVWILRILMDVFMEILETPFCNIYLAVRVSTIWQSLRPAWRPSYTNRPRKSARMSRPPFSSVGKSPLSLWLSFDFCCCLLAGQHHDVSCWPWPRRTIEIGSSYSAWPWSTGRS